jgi:uncharacterized membrane protein YkgB
MSPDMKASLGSLRLVRIALGLVYFYFGFLKFFPAVSPAELLAGETIVRLSFGWLEAGTALRLLALLECSIGLLLLLGIHLRVAFALFFFHMAGTATPLFLLPELTFRFPFIPTLAGQYILKNVVFIAAGWAVILPTLREEAARKKGARGRTILSLPRVPGSKGAEVEGGGQTRGPVPGRSSIGGDAHESPGRDGGGELGLAR